MSTSNKPTTAADLAEFEQLASLTTAGVKPTGTSRWERKQAALQKSAVSSNTNTPSKRQRASGAEECTPSKIAASSDRFIPNRSNMDMINSGAALFAGAENAGAEGEKTSDYASMLEKALGGGGGLRSEDNPRESRILSFKNKAPVSEDVSLACLLMKIYSSNSCDAFLLPPTHLHLFFIFSLSSFIYCRLPLAWTCFTRPTAPCKTGRRPRVQPRTCVTFLQRPLASSTRLTSWTTTT